MDPRLASVINYLSIGVCFVAVIAAAWVCRVAFLARRFLDMAAQVVETQGRRTKHLFFYEKDEMRGIFKGRDVVIGISHAGLRGEGMSFPFIALRLHETMGYNLDRLPHYAVIEKDLVVYCMKSFGLLGVFGMSYPLFFSRKTLIIALDRLFATAQDLEGGRTYREVFE